MDIIQDVTQALSAGLLKQIFSPQSRSYWVYLVCSAILALVILSWERRTAIILPSHLRSFGRESWLSRSAINDYGLILINALLFALLLDRLYPEIGPWSRAFAGALPQLAVQSAWWTPWLLTFCLFVVDDFIRFVAHYLEHRLPFLWELHKVHHSARVMNFLTAERHHPLSTLYIGLMMSVALILTNALFLAVFREKISIMSWLGGNFFWVASNLLGGTLRHSSVWLSFGPRLERWIISPAQHQIHHSDDIRHFDCNFGSTLAIWDRMFGTLYTTGRRREVITYGLGDENRHYDSLYGLYARPITKVWKMLMGRGAIKAVLPKAQF